MRAEQHSIAEHAPPVEPTTNNSNTNHEREVDEDSDTGGGGDGGGGDGGSGGDGGGEVSLPVATTKLEQAKERLRKQVCKNLV
jgi:hypothetical protein